ncbi:hypothetical protein [Devosia sp. A16]|uniref:hypothetical protein n=1 Tax=Devosia sp. A16 TaxID=1736675 RepID=UPI0006D84619|nr:hypothetical protein [Devosia sp. A16]
MRLLPLSLLLVLPLLAACDSGNTPKAPSAEAPAAAVTPAKTPATGKTPATPASTAKLPPGARPLIGSWAALDCTDKTGLTVVSATSYSAGGKSCDIAFSDNKDGTFSATCNKQTLKLTPIFGPSGEGIRIAVGDAKPNTVFRCSK